VFDSVESIISQYQDQHGSLRMDIDYLERGIEGIKKNKLRNQKAGRPDDHEIINWEKYVQETRLHKNELVANIRKITSEGKVALPECLVSLAKAILSKQTREDDIPRWDYVLYQ